MPITDNGSIARTIGKLDAVTASYRDDLKEVGDAAAESIVQHTLAGIGENDEPFVPYSPAYQEQLEAVGGKPGGVVNLRGMFLHDGQRLRSFRSAAGREKARAGRRGEVTVTVGGKTFIAQTPRTRGDRGLTDAQSEMSLDLIRVKPLRNQVTLTYASRAADYMLVHQTGDGKTPQRKWFTIDRAGTAAAVLKIFGEKLAQRVRRFNERGSS